MEKTFYDAWGVSTLYEVKRWGRLDHLRAGMPYGDPVKWASVHFMKMTDEAAVLASIPYDLAVRLREALPSLIEAAKGYARAEHLIRCYSSRTGEMFDFSDIHIDKDRPAAFYLGFDAGDADDSDPDECIYQELYRYIGFDADLKICGDWYDETIDR